MIKRFFQTFQNMGSVFSFVQIKFGAPCHHFLAMVNEFLKQSFQSQYLGLNAVHQSQHIEMERLLKFGVFKKLVKNFPRESVLLQIYGNSQAVFVRLVPYVPDAVHFFVFDQIGDVFDKLGFVCLIRNFRDNYLKALFPLNYLGLAPHYKRASSGSISIVNIFFVIYNSSCWKVGALNEVHKLGNFGIGTVGKVREGIKHFTQIMGRDIGSHTDGYTHRAVY